jgi:chemotaxis protein methyltransferase CheR
MTSNMRESSVRLNDKDFKFVCEYAYDVAGIVLGESKKEMVYRRLTRIVKDKKLRSFTEYCEILRINPETEKDYFINAITTNLTSFYRESHHFDFLAKKEFPKLLEKNKHEKRVRLWSSACSTGEEPYSLAITAFESFTRVLSTWDVKILATDIDSNVLAQAKSGIYDKRRIEDLPAEVKNKYFKRGSGDNLNKVKVTNNVQSLITFKQLNLLHEWPMKGMFDVIFCRNVIIYFDKPTQQDLFERYYHALKPGAILLLGHSENLGAYQQYFENIGRTIFRKPY